MLETLFKILIAHLIGDYVLQNDFLAKTKGENWYHLFVHSALYVVPFYILFGFGWEIWLLLWHHFTIDSLKARHGVIGYVGDQLCHYLMAILLFEV